MKHPIPDHNPMRGQYAPAPASPKHFALSIADGVATVTLNRPDRKNPLTFDSYAELRDWFNGLQRATDVKAVVLTGAGGNFCSGGDVHEIIGPLTTMTMPELLAFTRMTGALVAAMRACTASSRASACRAALRIASSTGLWIVAMVVARWVSPTISRSTRCRSM